MSKRVFWGLIGLISTGVLAAPVDSLDMAVSQAITQNPDVKSSWHAFEAAGDAVRAAEGGYYPRVDLQANGGHERRDPEGLAAFSYDPYQAEVSLTQMLFDGFETRNQVTRFDHERKRLYYTFREASEEAALEATRAYLDVSRFQKLVALAKDNYLQHYRIFEDIEERALAGVGRKVDVEQASARLALAETNLLTEATNLHDVSARFQRIVGELPAENLQPAVIESGLIPAETGQALNAAYMHSPSLNAAVENTLVAQAERKIRSAPMQPRLDLRLRHEIEDNTEGVNRYFDTSAVELLFSYNLYRGGSDQARIREADHLVEQAVAQQRRACRDLRQTLVIAHNDINSLAEQIEYLDRNRKAVGNARVQYRKQFDIGKRTLLDLLDTENEYFDVRRNYINTRYDLQLAEARTLNAMGQLIDAYSMQRRGLTPDASVPVEDNGSRGRCPEAVPAMPVVDKTALLNSVLEGAQWRNVGDSKMAYRINAHFKYNSADLSTRYDPDIERAAAFLRRYPTVNAVIEGHTDSRGTESYNQRLSEQRAQAIYDRLVNDHGIDPTRLTVKGYGETRPIAGNDTDDGRRMNRRVDMVIEKPSSLEGGSYNSDYWSSVGW